MSLTAGRKSHQFHVSFVSRLTDQALALPLFTELDANVQTDPVTGSTNILTDSVTGVRLFRQFKIGLNIFHVTGILST